MSAVLDPRERFDNVLLRRYHLHHDLAARAELAERCMPLVRSVVRRYSATSEPFDDLLQSGSVGLVKAIDRFDPDGGGRFVSYAVPTIQGEIRRHFRDRCWAVRVPRPVQELWLRVRRMQDEILRETGEPARDDDLATALGVGVDEVREARRAGDGYATRSLDGPAGEDRRLLDLLGDPEDGYAGVDDRALLDEAYSALDERAERVVRERFEEGRLQREIAVDVGVSQMQVSRILRRALSDMRLHLEAADGRGGAAEDAQRRRLAA